MTRFQRTSASALPFMLLLLAGCGDDLESRNAAVGLEDDDGSEMVITRQSSDAESTGRQEIDGLGDVDRIADDFAMDDDVSPIPSGASENGEDDGEPTIVDASPDDLRDMAQGFSPEPADDASGIDPSPILPEPVSD